MDEYQFSARSALFNRVAQNQKTITEKKLFDADKAHRRVEQGSKDYKDSKETLVSLERYRKSKEAMKEYLKQFTTSQKGG